MGICSSSQISRKNGALNWPPTAKIINLDGKLQEFKLPIKASHVLSQNPSCFLCSSESMYVDRRLPPVPEEEELQVGQIYFLMPISKSHMPLSLQELGALAIKAASGVPLTDGNGGGFLVGIEGYCKIPTKFQVGRRSQLRSRIVNS